VPPARDRQPSKGYPRAALGASQRDCNNIPYIALPFLAIGPQLPLPYNKKLLRASLEKGLEKC